MEKQVTVVSFPWPSIAPYKFLSDMISILDPICNEITILTGNTGRITHHSEKVIFIDIGTKLHYSNEIRNRPRSYVLWAYNNLKIQILEANYLLKNRKKNRLVLFYVIHPYYVPQLLVCKICGIRTLEVITRSAKRTKPFNISFLFEKFIYNLLDGISPESKVLVNGLPIPPHKLLPEGARYIDTERYQKIKSTSERSGKVGYIGRLSQEKGVMQFLEAIPMIVKNTGIKQFYIGGTGSSFDLVRESSNRLMREHDIHIEVPGFIPEEEMPLRLNELTLLILPTKHAEGLPTVILEAMACGTPVVATDIGAITGVISHGVTGFINKSTEPEIIASSIKEAMESDLDRISNNARSLVEQKYSFGGAVDRWSRILS